MQNFLFDFLFDLPLFLQPVSYPCSKYDGKASWEYFLSRNLLSSGRPLVIESTSYHRKDLSSSRVPLIVGSTSYHREYLLSSEAPLIIEKTSSYRECKASWDLLSSEAPLIIESTSYHRKDLFLSRVQSIMGPLVIGSTSYHREYLLSSEAPLIIEKTSSYRGCKASWDLLSSEAPLIIEKTSYHRKDLLSSETPLLAAPLVIERHFCQTGSVIWLAILKIFYFTWFCIKFQEKLPNFKELAQKLQELWTKTFGASLKTPGLNRVNYSNGKLPYPRGKL